MEKGYGKMIYALKQSLFYVLLILTFILYGDVRDMKLKQRKKKLFIVAHRGASDIAPENTFAAFDKAIQMNADYIELDVQLNRNGELVVIHDTTLERTTNAAGPVKNLTNKAQKRIDAGSWFHDSFRNERIPMLKEVLKRYSGKVGMLIELKNPSLYPGIELKLAKELKKHLYKQSKNTPFVVQSFDHQSILKFHKFLPSVETAVLIGFTSPINVQEIQSFSSYANYVNPHFLLIDDELVNMASHFGMGIFAWTVNHSDIAEKLLEMGIDGIVTNRPDLFKK